MAPGPTSTADSCQSVLARGGYLSVCPVVVCLEPPGIKFTSMEAVVGSVGTEVSLPPQLGGFQMVINTQRLCVQFEDLLQVEACEL
ncbi:unnamed protein product, partial [Symbiodinium sp. CCMP2456]